MDATSEGDGGRPLLELDDISVVRESRTILKNITLQVKAGEKISVVGPNGGGKTTLLKVAMGAVFPSAGKVRRKRRIRIGYQPQRTVMEPNLPMTAATLLKSSSRNGNGKIDETLEALELPAEILGTQMHLLSGGERQRVMIARAMLCEPDLLVLDEPGTYSDPRNLSNLYRAIEDFSVRTGCATMMVSHDIMRVLAHSDRILCISAGLICEGGPSQIVTDTEFEAMFNEPAHTGIYRHRH